MSLVSSIPFEKINGPSQDEISNVATFLNKSVELVDAPGGREVMIVTYSDGIRQRFIYPLPDFSQIDSDLANMPYEMLKSVVDSSGELQSVIYALEAVITDGVLYSTSFSFVNQNPLYFEMLALYGGMLACIELYRLNPEEMRELARIGLLSIFTLFRYMYEENNFSREEQEIIAEQLEKLGIDFEQLTFEKLFRIYGALGLHIPEESIQQIFRISTIYDENMEIDEKRMYWENLVLEKYGRLSGIRDRVFFVHANPADDDSTARIIYGVKPIGGGVKYDGMITGIVTRIPTQLNEFMKYLILNYGKTQYAFKNEGSLTQLMTKAISANIACKGKYQVIMLYFDKEGEVGEIPIFGRKGGLTSKFESYRQYKNAKKGKHKKGRQIAFNEEDRKILENFINDMYQATVEGRIVIIKR